MLSLFLIIADIASGIRLLWILYISLAKLILYIKAKEDHLAFFITSALDVSQGSSKITLPALQCSASNALKPSLFVRPLHTDIPYTIDGIITLKYKSNNIFAAILKLGHCSKKCVKGIASSLKICVNSHNKHPYVLIRIAYCISNMKKLTLIKICVNSHHKHSDELIKIAYCISNMEKLTLIFKDNRMNGST